MTLSENIVCGVISGAVVWWLLERNHKPVVVLKPSAPSGATRSPRAPLKAVRPCGC